MGASYEDVGLMDLRAMIVRFNNDPTVQRLESLYRRKTIPEILGVSRRELSHSGFLAWMLDPAASHGLGDFGIRRFLEVLMTSPFWPQDIQGDLGFDNLLTGTFTLASALVRREVSLGSAGRVDLLLELRFRLEEGEMPLRIVVENKVLAGEGRDQTRRYYSHFSDLGDGFVNLYVYLTPLSTLDLVELAEQECEDKHFIQINYQMLVETLLEPAMDRSTDPEVRMLVGQYVRSLGQPAMDEEDADTGRGMIMAIGKEERELLQKFWAGNQTLIQAALFAMSSDPNQDQEVRETVREALSSISGTGKDRGRVTIRYRGAVAATVIKSDLGLETLRLLDREGLIDDGVLTWLREDMSCNLRLLKTRDEVTATETRYRKYRIHQDPELNYGGEGYYVVRNWGLGNIDRFIDKMAARFPGLVFNLDSRS